MVSIGFLRGVDVAFFLPIGDGRDRPGMTGFDLDILTWLAWAIALVRMFRYDHLEKHVFRPALLKWNIEPKRIQ